MTKLKIIIIDDEIDFCTIMQRYLHSKNHEVSVANSLHKGLKLLEETNTDILILDNNLPDGKGWDHLDTLTRDFPLLKIFLVSAYRQRSDVSNPSPNVTVWEKPVSLNLLKAAFDQ